MIWLVYRALKGTSGEIYFRSVRNDGFIQLSKLRQNKSTIPARLSRNLRQAQGFFSLADPAPR